MKKIRKYINSMSLKRILKTTSAIGVAYGMAYYLQKYNKESKPDHQLEENAKIRLLKELSEEICSSIELKYSLGNAKKTPEIVRVFKSLSHYTKSDEFLDRFLELDGIKLIQEVVLEDEFSENLQGELKGIITEIFAHISRHKFALSAFNTDNNISRVLTDLQDSNDIIVQLNLKKIQRNTEQLSKSSQYQSTLYYPDVFLLDKSSDSSMKQFDVVFMNGMLGSVYFTWRQNDSSENESCSIASDSSLLSKCWPKDWLSADMSRARILGVNALLRPFIWNEMSDIDKINRGMEERAQDIYRQLEHAGMGRRPIVWVTHSAGGILLKLMLRANVDKPIAQATAGVVFMSTPHTGAQSLLPLYYFPFKYLLTPEARTMETRSEYLIELNNWFRKFASSQDMKILILSETEPTQISKLYHTVIVPNYDGDFGEAHNEIKIKSCHQNINKPKSRQDDVYRAILDFMNKFQFSSAPNISPARN